MLNTIYSMITMILITAVVLLIAYFTTRLIGQKTNFFFGGRFVKVIERTPVTALFNISIIQIKGKIYILAVQNKSIEVVDIISLEEWENDYNLDSSKLNAEHKDIIFDYVTNIKAKLKDRIKFSNFYRIKNKTGHKDDGND